MAKIQLDKNAMISSNLPVSLKPLEQTSNTIDDFPDIVRKLASQRFKANWNKRIKRLFIPGLRQDEINCKEIKLSDLRRTIKRRPIPKSACSGRSHPSRRMENDCEDCKALYAYARLMRKALYFIRDTDHHDHRLDSLTVSIDDPEINAYQIPAPEPTPQQEKEAQYDEMWNAVDIVLTEKERQIIHYRFIKGMTLQETGDIIGFTRERVRQLQNRSLLQLKEYLTRPTSQSTNNKKTNIRMRSTRAKKRKII